MRSGLTSAPTRDAGLTLIELAVAVLILSIATVATLRAFDQSRLAIGGAQERALAQLVARNRAEELRAFGAQAALPAHVTMGQRRFVIDTTTTPTAAGLLEATITARADTATGTGAGALYVIYLPAGLGQ